MKINGESRNSNTKMSITIVACNRDEDADFEMLGIFTVSIFLEKKEK